MKNLFLQNRLFLVLLIIVVGFALSFGFNFLFPVFQVALLATIALVLVDVFILFIKKQVISVDREMSEQLSLGDVNNIKLTISSTYTIPLDVEVIDELPYQLQKRDSSFSFSLSPNGVRTVLYTIEPKERGVYEFGNVNVFVSSALGLVQRRYSVDKKMEVGVYPSILQMRKHDFQVFNK